MSHGIKVLTEDDLPKLNEWESVCFPCDEWTPKMLLSHLEFHHGFQWNVDQAFAYALVCETPWEIEIFRIASLPMYRRTGAAFALLTELFLAFPNKDFFLEAKESNLVALALYKKVGFETLETRKNYYPDGSTAIIMARKKIE